MSQMPVPVVLGGVPIDPHCGPVRWREEPFGGFEEVRMMDGTAIVQEHWRRYRITASGSGTYEPVLTLDFSQPVELWGIKPRGLTGTGLLYQLPPATQRRPDVAPWALARIGWNWVEVAMVLAGDLATVTPAPGADVYRVCWLPRFTVVMPNGVPSELDDATGRYDWSFEAKER